MTRRVGPHGPYSPDEIQAVWEQTRRSVEDYNAADTLPEPTPRRWTCACGRRTRNPLATCVHCEEKS